MKTEEFKYRLSASVSGDTLRRIYAALEDEEHPYRATVRRIRKNARKSNRAHMVIIESNDRDYFASLLAGCKNLE